MPNLSSSFACRREEMLCLDHMNGVLYVHYIANVVLNAFLALISVLGNGLVFAAYYSSPSLRRPIHMIMMSLAVTDFLCGATSQPLYIWEKLLMARGCFTGTALCSVTTLEKFSMLFLIGATVLNLSATALDRYIVVFHYFKYSELVTKSRVKKWLGAMWVVWLIAALGILRGGTGLFFGLMLGVNIIVIVVLYFKVLREMKQMEANVVNTQGNQDEEQKAIERKIAKLVGLMLASLLLSFVPFIIFGLFTSKWNIYSKEILLIYASTAAFSNSASNVFIYYWKNEEMRTAMLKVIRKITHRSGNQINPQ